MSLSESTKYQQIHAILTVTVQVFSVFLTVFCHVLVWQAELRELHVPIPRTYWSFCKFNSQYLIQVAYII